MTMLSQTFQVEGVWSWSLSIFSWYLLGVEILYCHDRLHKTPLSFRGIFENFWRSSPHYVIWKLIHHTLRVWVPSMKLFQEALREISGILVSSVHCTFLRILSLMFKISSRSSIALSSVVPMTAQTATTAVPAVRRLSSLTSRSR